eukprot:TRINITY_DN50379_c0_g1_i1.p1 TRINITY_DN50379_c0_g1~~TRINITY_DN50379_c0_g1_i1.p1  ORF type:complete len:299 (+),score=46.81 TRINITY_DN50379_c0_g1_i1:83-979(+)
MRQLCRLGLALVISNTAQAYDITELLSSPRLPSLSDQLAFERQGHVVTRQVLTPSALDVVVGSLRGIAEEERQVTAEHAAKVMAEQGFEDIPPPFMHIINPHRRHKMANYLACAPALAAIAATLLGVKRLRLYQSSIFWKRPGDDATAWHADLMTSPVASNSFITAWMPLQPVTANDSPLVFQTASHRDMAGFVHEESFERLGLSYDDVPPPDEYGDHHAPLALGDVTWHHGWIMHGAPTVRQGSDGRMAFTASYFADGALIAPVAGEMEDLPSYEAWIHDMEEGMQAAHPLLPLVYP